MKKPYLYCRDDRGFVVDEVRAVRRGWWCPVCKTLTYTANLPVGVVDRCECPALDKESWNKIKSTWLPVYSEPVRRGKNEG